MRRRRFLAASTALAAAPPVVMPGSAAAASGDLVASIEREVLRRNRDGSEGTTWFHPRACMVPPAGDSAAAPEAFLCLQPIGGSDYFGPEHASRSADLGRTWTDPAPIPPLGRIPVPGHPGLEAGVCDVVPQYHPPTDTVLAMGHVVFYRGPRFSKKDQLSRYPVYAVRSRDGAWSERRVLEWDDPRGSFIYTNNCGQRHVLPDGDVLMSFTFGPRSSGRMVAGVRCAFDGETLHLAEVGPPLQNDHGRGLLEPSVTEFGGRYYLTIRAEDGHGYVSVSDDGLRYAPKRAWAWDDGEPLAMSTTQQHWLRHSDALYLVYTRRDERNVNVMRWRSPLWMARVDPEKLHLLRDTERVVLPLLGDGVNEPDAVPRMGNFHTTAASPHESWVTVADWVPKDDARGNLHLARIRWRQPNRDAPAAATSGEATPDAAAPEGPK